MELEFRQDFVSVAPSVCPSTTSNTLSAKEPALSCPPDSQFGIPFRHL